MTPRDMALPGIKRRRLQEERIAELLDIAAGVFIQDGFAAASTNKIARLANASKTTFYSRFPTKEDLFLAVIERRMNAVFRQVAQFVEADTLETNLRAFCVNLIQIALSPDQVSLIRMISMEADRYPELARRFYDNGPGRGEQALAAYLSGQIQLGRLRDEDPSMMARHMMSLVTGSPVRWFVLGLHAEPLSAAILTRHVEESIAFFFRAYAPDEHVAESHGSRSSR